MIMKSPHMDILQKTIAYSQLSISYGEVAAKNCVNTGRLMGPRTIKHVVSVAADSPHVWC